LCCRGALPDAAIYIPVMNLSVYPEQMTGEHYCRVLLSVKWFDCSESEFLLCQFCIPFLKGQTPCQNNGFAIRHMGRLALQQSILLLKQPDLGFKAP
jgi:hypothetical protein